MSSAKFINKLCRCIYGLVKGLYCCAYENLVQLQPVYLREWDEVRAAMPKRPHIFQRQPEVQSLEEATCWAIAARSRQKYFKSACSRGEKASTFGLLLPIHIYMLGPPCEERARFAHWFKMAADPKYRIILSRTPTTYRGRKFSTHLGPDCSERPRAITSIQDHLTAAQKAETRTFLQELVEAYWFGQIAVEELLKTVGHPYWFSDGLPARRKN